LTYTTPDDIISGKGDSRMSDDRWDVIAVNLATHKIRILDHDKDFENADAIVRMAVLRRGTQEEIFKLVRSGAYAEGDSIAP
jgi:hypothetical protein